MTESERLERMDRHTERGNEIMARSDETMKRSNEVMAEHREFIREITVRQEGVTQQLVRQIDANTKVMEDVSLATRQHTRALASILDRLN